MTLKTILLAGAISMLCQAAAMAQQATPPGAALTPFGAETAASADGAVPAYTGGIAAMTGLPAASSSTGYADPFAGEKPLFTVTAANMQQYAAKLTPGEMALLSRYPNDYMNVYPSHRTMSYPDWVLKNSAKNASSAQLTSDGDGVQGAYGGIPFPMPQNGNEVVWNAFLSYHPAYCHKVAQAYDVDASGALVDLGAIEQWEADPYYDPSQSQLQGPDWYYYKAKYHSPPEDDGETYLFKHPVNFTTNDDVTWFYDPATRRVRLAPEFKYDTPIASYGGTIDYDEIGLFAGDLSKFDWHLVGKQEIIVPYNDYSFTNTPVSQLYQAHFLDPAAIRWEVHRVWVVQATLKSDQRHIYSKWDFYFDEDSWHIMATESYDHGGNIYRVGFSFPYLNYGQGDATTMIPSTQSAIYDLSKGGYTLANTSALNTRADAVFTCSTTMPNMRNFTPQAMAGQAVQ